MIYILFVLAELVRRYVVYIITIIKQVDNIIFVEPQIVFILLY